MKFSTSSILLASAAWTIQAIPTAIPSSLRGRSRGLAYNSVRSIYQSQRKLARQESTAANDAQIPDATSVADIPMSEPLPPTSVAIVTSDPVVITSVADILTSEPLPPTTSNAIISEPTEITSVAGIPTTEPLLPPTTTDEITSEAITIPRTLLIKFRQQTQVATPIETFPATLTPVLPTDFQTAVETFVETPTPAIMTDIPIAVETLTESPTAVLPTDLSTAVQTLIARSPYTDTVSPLTTTSSSILATDESEPHIV